MVIRCPHCNARTNVADGAGLQNILCTECSGKFNLIQDDTVTFVPGPEQHVSRFQLSCAVGVGAYGTVWKAYDPELDRAVALKIPSRDRLTTAETEHFLHEARAAGRLKHRNVVSVHEVGRDGETVFIVSDFIDGVTLGDWLSGQRPTAREAAELCAQIADALHHAHQADVVHCDLKPGNIMLDSGGVPYVTDFGLAKREAADVTVTYQGVVMGTPAYMSPEQAAGRSQDVDRRSDIYSLGVVLFELLTGERPFRGNHRMVLHQVVNDEPPRPRKLSHRIPRDLETICLKCLEKSPGRRYQTAAELRDDLNRFLSGEPIRARPVSALERLRKWTARRPAVATLIAAVFLLTVVGISGIAWQWYNVLAAQKRHSRALVELVLNAEPEVVPSVVANLDEFREWVDPELKRRLLRGDLPEKHRYRANLALLPADAERAQYVLQRLLSTEDEARLDMHELACGAEALVEHRGRLADDLWSLLGDPGRPDEQRFRAALILARTPGVQIDPADEARWAEVAGFVTGELVRWATSNPNDYTILVHGFRAVRKVLLGPLAGCVRDDRLTEAERLTATSVAAEYAKDDARLLTELSLELRGEQYGRLLPHLKRLGDEAVELLCAELAAAPEASASEAEMDALASRQASAAVTLLHLEHQPDGIWLLLKPGTDTRLRSFLVHRFAELRLPPRVLSDPLLKHALGAKLDTGIRRALVLSLGEYPSVKQSIQAELVPELVAAYKSDPDCGFHSAVAWLLTRWGKTAELERAERDLTEQPPMSRRRWYVNSQGTTMAVIEDPPVFLMGSPETEPAREGNERRHLRRIGRTFAIATTEVTVAQFEEFLKEVPTDHKHPAKYGPEPDGPVLAVSWVQAIKYCRWLSDKERVAEDQMCYPPLGQIDENISLADDFVNCTGYRLPTEGEWECACRAGTTTRRFYGDADRMVAKYGWYLENAHDQAWPVRLLKPNDYGLFDVYGNAWEWCQDRYAWLPATAGGRPFLDVPNLVGKTERVLRGGSLTNRAEVLRSAHRDFLEPTHNRNHNVGFRVARTLPPEHKQGEAD